MVAFLLVFAPAAACEPESLRLRTFQPRDGAADVPLDVRVAVSFIGWGTADQTVATVYDSGGVEVAATREAWCYLHEGPAEVHCWLALRPAAPLSAGATYTIAASAGADTARATFTTGAAFSVAPEGAPTLAVADAWEATAQTECDFALADRYTLVPGAVGGAPDPSTLSLFHLYALDAAGEPGAIIHSVFVSNPDSPTQVVPDLKQYLDGAEPNTGCFRLIQEGPSGARSAAADACWAAPDTGDTGADDTADSTGGAEDSAGDSGRDGDAAGDAPAAACGCAAGGGVGPGGAVLVALFGGVARRRSVRGTPLAAVTVISRSPRC